MEHNKTFLLRWSKALFLAFLVGATIWILRDRKAPYQHNEGQIFGTTYHITYQSPTDFSPEIQQELQRVDEALSLFNPDSWLSRYNRGENPAPNVMATEVISLAMRISQETEGAFDITVAPLVNAWGFGFRSATDVTPEAIDSLRQFVGMDKVRLGADGRGVKDDPRTLFDCSAIAKGFGSDRVGMLFDSLGIHDYMVEIGGEVVVRGTNPKAGAWRIGISKPVEDSLSVSQELDPIVALTHCALATSGNYRNFYYKNGRRYAHTVDPRLGIPVQHSVLSATVIAPTCMEADALATTFMVIGADSSRRIVDARSDLRAYLICDTDSGMTSVRLGNWEP